MLTCLSPKIVFNPYLKEHVSVPCGKCSACRTLKSSEWANRCDMECRCHKYTLFVTLTYAEQCRPIIDLRTFESDSDTFDQSVADSSEYVNLRDGRIPVVSIKDFQDFMKRLRISLFRGLHLNEKERILRYFCTSEYGPTTFHPHYHMLLWFDSDIVAKSIKEYIYKAWFPKNPHKSLSSFLERNRCEFVRFNASQYVAGYLNTDSVLPSILREKQFRTWHTSSKCPPIGSLYLQQEQIRSILFGHALTVSIKKSITGRIVDLPLWRSFESRYVPKCLGFSSLSTRDRISLYNVSSISGEESSFEAFKSWLLPKWFSPLPLFELLRKVTRTDSASFDEIELFSREDFINTLRRIFYTSRRFRSLRRAFFLSSCDYVKVIERYYSRKDYSCLVAQLRMEEELSSSPRSDCDISFLPYFIDPLFYERFRKLSPFAVQCYDDQFGLDDYCRVDNHDSYLYKTSKSFYDGVRLNNTKVRQHKDFVATHPEYASVYKQNLLSFSL